VKKAAAKQRRAAIAVEIAKQRSTTVVVEIPRPALVTFEAYQASCPDLFPTLGSLAWFVKVHKAKLHETGAVVVLNGRNTIQPSRMAEQVVELAQESTRSATTSGQPSTVAVEVAQESTQNAASAAA
jgi:hypothetical protein